jgi:hypothetical protein
MKKVRVHVTSRQAGLLLGAIGAAPAVVAMTGPTEAVAAVTHAPRTGKTVSAISPTPLITCGQSHDKVNGSYRHSAAFSAAIHYGGRSCIHSQNAVLHLQQFRTGLEERVRYYSGGGARIRSEVIGGGEYGASISYHSAPDTYAHEVCQAVVPASSHNDTLWGPVCETD